MDPPPLPPLPTTAAPPPQPTTATDSVESSPRTRTAEHHHPPPPSDDQSLPSLPSKLRLMCSFGGHIIPRPHDKTLCYVGGETRIVVVDRNSSLAELSSRISKTLLNGRPFTLKYQLPNEDLDSLISVTTDEDLENMIEEYDRVCTGNPMNKPLRIRLFLFFVKPESVMSMGALLGDAKSESWFVDALNSADDLPRGLSDSATMDNLLNLDGVVVNCGSGSSSKLEGQGGQGQQMQGEFGNEKQVEKSVNEVHSMPNSPMVENSSSFGSSSSTPSMANLPPIRTRVEDNRNNNGGGSGGLGARVVDQKERVGVEEQFAQIGVGVNVNKQQQDEGFGVVSSAVPSQPVVVTAVNVAAGAVPSGVGVSNEYVNRVLSDDERSDQGVQVGLRKPPLPMQLGQPRPGVAYNLHSPDSVASDGSIASASSFSRQMFYQEQAPAAPRDNRAPASPTQKTDASIPSPQVHMQQVQLPRYVVHPQGDQQQHHHHQQQQQQQPQQQQHQQPQQQQPQQQPQQQFVHAGTHYIAHPPSGQVPLPSYYQMYAHQPSQQQQQQQIHHPIDQQYPVYVMPMMQPPPYNMSMQSHIADSTTTTVAGNRTIASPNPNLVASSAAYKDGVPPIYPAKAPSPATPETSSSIYKTAGTSTPQLVQIPSSQYQPQYVAYSQMHHPSQSISVASSAGGNYGYEYASSAHDQGYYSQHPTTGYPAQYQTMTAAAAVELSDASKQLPTEQQTRTSQP